MKLPLLLPCLLIPMLPIWVTPASAAVAQRIEDLYNPKLAPFYHGVASGDPLPDGFILWTRVTEGGKSRAPKIRVIWYVATDKELKMSLPEVRPSPQKIVISR